MSDTQPRRLPFADLFNLKGKTAIVTGAAQGMGQGIAFRLADAGANIVVSARRRDAAEETAAQIRAEGGNAAVAMTEMTDPAQIEATVTLATETFGSVDILVNCAGGGHINTPFVDLPPDMLDVTIQRNFMGTYRLSQAAARAMIAAGRGGRIVNIASTAAFRSDYQSSAYNASKAAIISLTQSMCMELTPHGINVNTVVPGPIQTPATDWVYENPKFKKVIERRVLVGERGLPDDIANAVLFAVSPASSYMTGATIVIDGGYMWT